MMDWDLSFILHAALWPLGYLLLGRIALLPGAGPSLPARKISVIIPARNEAARLPRLLESLRHQTLSPHEILVVDDHSEDTTAEVGRGWGARLIASKPLPAGWTGKTWACHQGAAAAAGDVLLFLDADTVVLPEGLARMSRAYSRAGGAVSVQPYHEMERPYEQLSAVFNLTQMAASQAFSILGRRVRRQRLFGPVMWIGADDYKRAGGHAAVRGQRVENFALSDIFAEAGLRVNAYAGRGAVHFRMYAEGLPALVRGWSKSIRAGARGSSIAVVIGTVAWLTGALGTARHLLTAAFAGAWGEAAGVGVGYALYAAQLFHLLRQVGRFTLWTALLYPVPMGFFALVFLGSLAPRAFRPAARWKGRTLPS